MKCVFDSYSDFTAGKDIGADEIFDNFPALAGRAPKTLADFAKTHAKDSGTKQPTEQGIQMNKGSDEKYGWG